MNIQLNTQGSTGFRPLAGKVSLITGSTSGIGLGIARALAAAGSDVVLNGFGEAAEIDAARERIATDCRRQCRLLGGRHVEAGGDRAR